MSSARCIFTLACILGVCHGYSNTCSHLVGGKLTCCQKDSDCGSGGACWACGINGTDYIDGKSYTCDTCSSPATPEPVHSNICQHLINSTLTCCKTDADCGDNGGMCWACPGGSSYVDGKPYVCDKCAVPPPSPPQTYPNVCQHLINNVTLKCCKTNEDCGDEGGACWACPAGSSYVDHKYFKCDSCQAM